MTRDRPLSAQALWITKPGEMEIRTVALEAPDAPNQQVRALYSGVSRGTESLILSGNVPDEIHDIMKVPFQEGSLSLPVKYGYSWVGEMHNFEGETERVFCLYPHQSMISVARDFLFLLPDDVPSRRAVLAANMETALNGLWESGIGPGDEVAIIGAGVIGLLVAFLAQQIPGVKVFLADTNQQKASIAEKLELPFASPTKLPRNLDLIFHASASYSGLQTALDHAGQDSVVVELSWYGARRGEISLGGSFHPKRVTIKSSQVGKIPPLRAPRWTHRRRLETALSLLSSSKLDHLLGPDIPFLDAPRLLPQLLAPDSEALCPLIVY